jgi:hypothetical protein
VLFAGEEEFLLFVGGGLLLGTLEDGWVWFCVGGLVEEETETLDSGDLLMGWFWDVVGFNSMELDMFFKLFILFEGGGELFGILLGEVTGFD